MGSSVSAEVVRARRLAGLGDAEDLRRSSGSTDDTWTRPVPSIILQSGMGPRRFTRLCIKASLVLGAGLMLGLTAGIWWAALGAGVSAAIIFFGIRRDVFLRAEAFERDYPAFLISLASAIRTGLDPLSALLHSERLFSPGSLVRAEILQLRSAIASGATEESAVRGFGEHVAHPDIQLFRIAFILARREGSSLAPCLQRLTKVIRQRQSFRRKMRAAIAMQKLSSLGIAGCSVVIALTQAIMNPQALQDAVADPFGVKALVSGGLLMLFGIGWMIQMTSARV